MALVLLSIILVGCKTDSKNDTSTGTESSVEKKETKSDKIILADQPNSKEKDAKLDKLIEKISSLDEPSYKQSTISLEDFERYPNENKEQKVYFLVKIIQQIDDPLNDNIYYLGFVTPEKNVRNTVALQIPKEEVYKKILVDDEVKVLARYKEAYEYKNVQDIQKSAPKFEVDMYQIDGEDTSISEN